MTDFFWLVYVKSWKRRKEEEEQQQQQKNVERSVKRVSVEWEIVEHLELDRSISEPFHARKDNFSFQLKKEKKEQQQQQQQKQK